MFDNPRVWYAMHGFDASISAFVIREPHSLANSIECNTQDLFDAHPCAISVEELFMGDGIGRFTNVGREHIVYPIHD